MNEECKGFGFEIPRVFVFMMKGMWNLASALMIVDMEKTQIGSNDTLNFRSSLVSCLNS